MRQRFKGLLLAAGVIPPNTPLVKRLELLNPYISPKPGTNLEVDKSLIAGPAVTTKNPEHLYGWIKISPPKGQCFIVTTEQSRPDHTICKPTSLKWHLRDLDQQRGTISWSIKTSAGDFGTPLVWQTPYVIAKVLPSSSQFNTESSKPEFFKSCTASLGREDGSPRKITLTKFNNQKWIVRFPEKDTPIAPKEEVAAAAPAEPKKENSGHDDGHGEKKEEAAHGDGSGEKTEAAKSPIELPKKDEPEPWTMNTGRGFEMNVGNFISDVAMPPGKKGTCRYVYDYPPGDFSRGRIECHHTDQYLYVYMIVPCLRPLMDNTVR